MLEPLVYKKVNKHTIMPNDTEDMCVIDQPQCPSFEYYVQNSHAQNEQNSLTVCDIVTTFILSIVYI